MVNGKIKSFRDLDVWRNGMEIVKKAYNATKTFPVDELYGLTSQIRRAAVSIPSNIAEGFNRFHCKEYKQFLAELETHIEIAFELSYIDEAAKKYFLENIDYESRMLANLIKKIK